LTGYNFLNWYLTLRSFHYSLYVRCILSWGHALGLLGGLSTGQLNCYTGQLNCCLPRMEEKRREKRREERYQLVLCDTHDTSILIIDTYVTIPVSPMSRYTAVYRSSTKYRETAQASRVPTIPCSSYHLTTCTLPACDTETNSKVAENHIITVQQ